MNGLMANTLFTGPNQPLDGFWVPLTVFLLGMTITWALTPPVMRLAIKYGALDDPSRDDRRVHKTPTPRWGGIAIFLGVFGALGVVLPWAYPTAPFPLYLVSILFFGGAIVVFGALDDLKSFSAKTQLIFLLVAGIGVQFIYGPEARVQIATLGWPWLNEGDPSEWLVFGWFAVPLTAIYLFVITKTMDTLDGLDGLTAGISGIVAATLGVVAVVEEQTRVALVCAAVSGASVGFLRFNYNPAKVFMGTGGAQFLGFALACLSIVGALKTAAAMALLVPLLVFGVQIFDAFFVVIRRLRSGAPIGQADNRHVHYSLLQKGLNQKQVVWSLYAVTAVLCSVLVIMVRAFS